MHDRQPEHLSKAARDGAREGLQEEVRTWGTFAKWGAVVGGALGAVGGVLVFGGPGVGIGLLIGVPGGAIVAWLAYVVISASIRDF